MKHSSKAKILVGSTSLVFLVVASSIGFLMISPGTTTALALSANKGGSGPSILPSTTLVSAPPAGANGPDDITLLANRGANEDNNNNNKALIWTAYQNGIMPNGTAGKPGGPTQSTVAGYDPSTGSLVKSIRVTGKVDGLTADPKIGKLIATVNEDTNSAFKLIDPSTGSVTTFTYKPNPSVGGNGGTDSIAVRGDGKIYVVHSNPNDTSQATEYRVTLNETNHIANLTPVFYNNSTATDAITGAKVHLNLTDPDTNYIMPHHASKRFAGELVTISQADGQLVFASLPNAHRLTVLNVTDNKPGNVPPLDGIAVATSDHGTLYVVDNKAGKIQALDTTGWPKGTVFVGEPNDNKNPLVGTLDLSTGKITPLDNKFQSPKGLLFVPAPESENQGESAGGNNGNHENNNNPWQISNQFLSSKALNDFVNKMMMNMTMTDANQS